MTAFSASIFLLVLVNIVVQSDSVFSRISFIHLLLGVDLSFLLCANDDIYSSYMIDMIYAVCEMSRLSTFASGFNEVNIQRLGCFFVSHGMDFSFTEEESFTFFFRHVLNGMCAHTDAPACRMIAQLSPVEISRRTFSIVSLASYSVLSIACESLGYFVDFAHRSLSPYDVMCEYRNKLTTFAPMQSHDFFSYVTSLSSFSDMILVSAVHGISLRGDLEFLREHLLQHLCYGGCIKRDRTETTTPVGCKEVLVEYSKSFDHHTADNFQAIFLYKGVQKLTRAQLIPVLKYYSISFDSHWSLLALCDHVLSTILFSENDNRLESCVEDGDHTTLRIIDLQTQRDHEKIVEEWPQELNEHDKKKLTLAFKNKTSSSTLKKMTCACCAENIFQHECEKIPVTNINLNLFRSLTHALPFSSDNLHEPYTSLPCCLLAISFFSPSNYYYDYI